jgi:hypothetical protein
MIDVVGRLGERLLARVLPQGTAGAFCRPQTYCEFCGGGWWKRIWIYADCSWDTTACGGC